MPVFTRLKCSLTSRPSPGSDLTPLDDYYNDADEPALLNESWLNTTKLAWRRRKQQAHEHLRELINAKPSYGLLVVGFGSIKSIDFVSIWFNFVINRC